MIVCCAFSLQLQPFGESAALDLWCGHRPVPVPALCHRPTLWGVRCTYLPTIFLIGRDIDFYPIAKERLGLVHCFPCPIVFLYLHYTRQQTLGVGPHPPAESWLLNIHQQANIYQIEPNRPRHRVNILLFSFLFVSFLLCFALLSFIDVPGFLNFIFNYTWH